MYTLYKREDKCFQLKHLDHKRVKFGNGIANGADFKIEKQIVFGERKKSVERE